jgi:hypothetical protein
MTGSSMRELYVSMLLERVRQEQFPSAEYLNRIERSLSTRDQFEAYLEILFERVEGLRFPSLAMLVRIDRIAAMLPRR